VLQEIGKSSVNEEAKPSILFCGVDNHQEDRISQKMIFKAPCKTTMSDVDVDKMGSAALSRKHNCLYLSVLIGKHVVEILR
jgi:hypothetical protein